MPPKRRRESAWRNRDVDTVIVAVDFGTTFSGVAFTIAPQQHDAKQLLEKIQVVETWPGGSGSSGKVPTELRYKKDEPGQVAAWGYERSNPKNRLICFKLLLDESKDFPSYVDRAEIVKKITQTGKLAVEIVSDYLGQLRAVTEDVLKQRMGEDGVAQANIEWTLTVPAVWSEAAKNATMTAAVRAKMANNLRLISEPEAAAVYTLTSMTDFEVKDGDVYVVLDAGGGTADLITYLVDRAAAPMKMHEVVPGQGGLAGGSFIDRAFEKHMASLMGERSFQTLRKEFSDAWATALLDFQNTVKRRFNPNSNAKSDREFRVPFPGVPDNEDACISRGYIRLSTEHLVKIFKPTFDKILSLIEAQVILTSKAGLVPRAIILVGGMGQSTYLADRVKEKFHKHEALKIRSSLNPEEQAATGAKKTPFVEENDEPIVVVPSGKTHHHVHILQPAHGWTAVARGAVYQSATLDSTVTSRKARRHYGVPCDVPFDARIHDPKTQVWDEIEETKSYSPGIEWFINKGDDVPDGVPYTLPYYRNFANNLNSHWDLEEQLYTCEEDVAPQVIEEGKVMPLCKLSVPTDKETIPHRFYESGVTSTGQRYKKLTYQLGVWQDSGILKFDFRVRNEVKSCVTETF